VQKDGKCVINGVQNNELRSVTDPLRLILL